MDCMCLLAVLLYAWFCHDALADDPVQPLSCSSLCKCESTVENQSPVSQNQDGNVDLVSKRESRMATCWVPSNLARLDCAPNWDILHLQILQGQLDLSNSSEHARTTDSLVSTELFANCASVSRLAIWERSQFTTLPPSILRPMANLERLFIQVPTMTTVPEHFFAFLQKLKFVVISKCPNLTEISRTVFEPCPASLHTLWLNGNGIRGRLTAGLFKQCDLRTLWLQDNRIERLDWGSLRGLTELTNLRVDQNSLNGSLANSFGYRTDMQSSALKDTPQLKFLDVSSNQITSINDHTWSGLCEHHRSGTSRRGLCYLEELDISRNRLEWISPEAFQGLPRLRKLNLAGNKMLYLTDSTGPLALVLYGLGTHNKHLTSVIIPDLFTDNISSKLSLKSAFDACASDNARLNQLPVVLKNVLVYLQSHSCSSILATTDTVSENSAIPELARVEVPQPDLERNLTQSSTWPSTARKSFFKSIRKADVLVLVMIGLGLVTVGVFIGLIPLTYILCSKKRYRQLSSRTASGRTLYPIWTHPGQQTGYLLTSNNPHLVQASPLPVRCDSGKSSRKPMLWTTPSHEYLANPFPQQPNQINRSNERIRMHSRCSTTPDQGRWRRVNSAGNVNPKSSQRTRQPTNKLPHINGRLSAQFVSAAGQQRNSGAPHLPVELRPLIQPPNTGDHRMESVYCPTAETATMGGSLYSLATLASHRARSPNHCVVIPTKPSN